MAKDEVKTAEREEADSSEDPKVPAKTNGGTAVAAVDEFDSMLLEDAGQDAFETQDVALPFIQILQALSPQLDKQDGEYIKGAEAGEFINTASGQRWNGEEGIIYIPVKYQRRYTEWKPKRGGLVKDWGTDGSIADRCHRDDATGRDITPDGNDLIVAATFYGLLVDGDKAPIRGLIGMSSTQFKKGRKWNALISSYQKPRPDGKGYFTPPMFARSYRLTSVPESNDQGNWYGFKVTEHEDTFRLPNGKDLYLLAREFRAQIDKGAVEVAAPPPSCGGGNTIDREASPKDDEIPF